MDLHQRLETLERSNIRLRRWCATLTGLVVVSLITVAAGSALPVYAGPQGKQKTIEADIVKAKAIQVGSGSTRINIWSDKEGGGIKIGDGATEVNLWSGKSGGAIGIGNTVPNENRFEGIMLVMQTETKNNGIEITPFGRKGGVVMEARPEGNLVTLKDAAGVRRVVINTLEKGKARGNAGILVNDRFGKMSPKSLFTE